eukprot:UN09238
MLSFLLFSAILIPLSIAQDTLDQDKLVVVSVKDKIDNSKWILIQIGVAIFAASLAISFIASIVYLCCAKRKTNYESHEQINQILKMANTDIEDDT